MTTHALKTTMTATSKSVITVPASLTASPDLQFEYFGPHYLQLPPNITHNEEPSDVPTEQVTHTWTSSDYKIFISNYTNDISEREPGALLQYNLSSLDTTSNTNTDARLEVDTKLAFRYIANIHHITSETKDGARK